jgi:hypothetical protein
MIRIAVPAFGPFTAAWRRSSRAGTLSRDSIFNVDQDGNFTLRSVATLNSKASNGVAIVAGNCQQPVVERAGLTDFRCRRREVGLRGQRIDLPGCGPRADGRISAADAANAADRAA